MPDSKKQLDITLTEPIVFLRTPDPSGQLHSDPDDPPTLVRGILTLNVTKPIGISSIQVELTGVLAINYPEAYGPRRIELPEKHKIYSSTVTIFRADQVPRGRYSASVGPRSPSANFNEDEHAVATSSRLPSLPRGRPVRRNIADVPPDLGPTPSYTVTESTPIRSRLAVPGEHPAQTLEELRQALRENLEGQPGFVSPSSLPHVSSSFTILRTHSNASSTSNEHLRLENGSRTDDLLHSPLDGDISTQSTHEDPSYILGSGPSPSRPFRANSSESIRGSLPPARRNSNDPSNASTSHSRLRLSLTSVLDAVREITSRTPSRSRSIARSEEMERGRTRFRVVAEEQSRESILELGEEVTDPRNISEPGSNISDLAGHAERREHHLFGLGRVLGWERDHEKEKGDEHKSKEHGESWKEFQPGTYSYPVSFLLPPHLPPSFSLPNGSLDYVIRGVAHRPGAFTSKLSCQVPLLIVASPAIETGEGSVAADPGPLFVQKQWQTKLAYSFGLSSRLFLLGSGRRLEAASSVDSNTFVTDPLPEAEARAEAAYGTSTLELTLLPIEKIKIWKLDVIVDQRIRYIDERGKSFREDEKRQVRVLEVQDTCSEEDVDPTDGEEQTNKNKHKRKEDSRQIPLLPTPISPHRSPLLRYLPPSCDPSILAGPGPYTLSTSIGLPGCNDTSGSDSGALHFTVKQKSSIVRVEHSLRLIMRVESVGAEDTNDHEGGEAKRIFDIAVRTPITILSCRCIPEYQTLPRYSPITEENLQDCVACPCQPNTVGSAEQEHGNDVGNYVGHVVTPTSASSFHTDNGTVDEHRTGHQRSRSPSRVGRSGPANSFTASLHPHLHSPTSWGRDGGWSRSSSQAPARTNIQSHHARSPSDSVSMTHARGRSQTPAFSASHLSRPPSPLARYERLVAGLESEAGEAPPSYESVASGLDEV